MSSACYSDDWKCPKSPMAPTHYCQNVDGDDVVLWTVGAAAAAVQNSSSSATQSATHPNPQPTHANQSQLQPPDPGQSAARPQQSGQSAARKAGPDGDGIALDRTPTDDEINWLWQKVRTCLSTSRAGANHATPPSTNPPATVNAASNAICPKVTNPSIPPNPSSGILNNPTNPSNPSSTRPSSGATMSSNRTLTVSRTYIDGTDSRLLTHTHTRLMAHCPGLPR